MVDIWPYSGRNDGAVSDSEHETLLSAISDGIPPTESSGALETTISGGSWSTQPGKLFIAGHILHVDSVASGPTPDPASATRYATVVAYIDRTQTPWSYGVRLALGAPGGGAPNLSRSRTGVYEVGLMTFTVSPTGTVTVRSDDRVFLTPAGLPLVGAWQNITLQGAFVAGAARPQWRISSAGRRVELRGTIQRNDGQPISGGGSGPYIGTLPAGARPSITWHIAGQASLTGAGTTGTCRLEIQPGGGIRLWTQDAPTWVGIYGGFWLD